MGWLAGLSFLGGVLFVTVLWLAYLGHRASGADWGKPWRNRVDGLVRIFCRRYHRLAADPIPLPARGGAIVVANHVSGLDPFLLISACDRPLRFMIAVEEYHRFGLRWLFRAAGCIPVDRTGRAEQSFRAAVRALKAGEVVALFPHGRIHLDDEPHHPIKPGVLKLAELAGVPIFPARLTGIAGQGHVVAGVIRRSHACLVAYTPIGPDAVHEPGFRERLGNLLIGRNNGPA